MWHLIRIICVFSKTPQFNATYEYTLGEETTFPGFPGAAVLTKTDANTFAEVWKNAAAGGGVTHSYGIKFNAFGMVLRSSTSGGGHVATSVYERINAPSLCGFFLLEKHENVEALMDKLSKKEVEAMFSNSALRITKSADNVYTSTDYLGTGAEKAVVFRLNEQVGWLFLRDCVTRFLSVGFLLLSSNSSS